MQAIYDSLATDQQRRAYSVVDAIDDLDCQLGALRAVECLAINEKLGSEAELPQLQRADLAMLVGVLTRNLQAYAAQARAAAVASAQGVSVC